MFYLYLLILSRVVVWVKTKHLYLDSDKPVGLDNLPNMKGISAAFKKSLNVKEYQQLK